MECPWCGREVEKLYEAEYGHEEVCFDCYFENKDEQALKGGE
jgi:hypothetical protein